MLALEVEYLLGRAVATDASRRDVPEWPPHPSRLFSALVDALGDVEADSMALHTQCDATLRWLEGLPVPEIRASVGEEVSVRSRVKYWVPINDEVADKVRYAPLVEQRKRQERYFPAAIPDDPKVIFAWPSVEPDESQKHALDALISRVPYLGHSSSLVRIFRTPAPPPRNLMASREGVLLRVPGPGRLVRLQGIHDLRRADTLIQPPRGREVAYAPVHRTQPRGPHGQAVVVTIRGFPVGLENQAALIARYRSALISLLGQEIPTILSGHEPDGRPAQRSHIAFVPLANVDHHHADGSIKGIAVVTPRDIPDEEVLRLESAMSRLRTLHFGARGELNVGWLGHRDYTQSLDFRRYARTAMTWVSVTPVALGIHPKPKKGLTEDVCLLREITRLGLPEPDQLFLQNVSFVRGAPRATDVARKGVRSVAGRLLRHVQVRFPRPVEGPLLLGAGRHWGFGVLLPWGAHEVR